MEDQKRCSVRLIVFAGLSASLIGSSDAWLPLHYPPFIGKGRSPYNRRYRVACSLAAWHCSGGGPCLPSHRNRCGDDCPPRRIGLSPSARGHRAPPAVADAMVALAAGDHAAYALAIKAVLDSFEERADFLEDARVADTVLVLQLLAAERGSAVGLPESELLPS